MRDESVSTFATAWLSALVMALMTMTADPVGNQSIPWWVKQFSVFAWNQKGSQPIISFGINSCQAVTRSRPVGFKAGIDAWMESAELMYLNSRHAIWLRRYVSQRVHVRNMHAIQRHVAA